MGRTKFYVSQRSGYSGKEKPWLVVREFVSEMKAVGTVIENYVEEYNPTILARSFKEKYCKDYGCGRITPKDLETKEMKEHLEKLMIYRFKAFEEREETPEGNLVSKFIPMDKEDKKSFIRELEETTLQVSEKKALRGGVKLKEKKKIIIR